MLPLFAISILWSESRHRNGSLQFRVAASLLCEYALRAMGITPAQLAARYWGYAAQCLVVAQRQDSAGDKLALIDMAQAWVNLAERTEKNEADFEADETPAPRPPEDMR
jgi:hypothetical protein